MIHTLKVGDYIVERTTGSHNIKVAKIIKENEIYDSYTIKVIKAKASYISGDTVTFGRWYISDAYKKKDFSDAELLAVAV